MTTDEVKVRCLACGWKGVRLKAKALYKPCPRCTSMRVTLS